MQATVVALLDLGGAMEDVEAVAVLAGCGGRSWVSTLLFFEPDAWRQRTAMVCGVQQLDARHSSRWPTSLIGIFAARRPIFPGGTVVVSGRRSGEKKKDGKMSGGGRPV
jgi:hypothetical protein